MARDALLLVNQHHGTIHTLLMVHRGLPGMTLFLQPYSGKSIAVLRDSPPSTDDPVQLLITTSEDPGRVSHVAEIVGWRDKREMKRRGASWSSIDYVVRHLQGEKQGLYDAAGTPEGVSVNLLFVCRCEEIEPVPISRLYLTGGKRRVKPGKRRGWAYVRQLDFE